MSPIQLQVIKRNDFIVGYQFSRDGASVPVDDAMREGCLVAGQDAWLLKLMLDACVAGSTAAGKGLPPQPRG